MPTSKFLVTSIPADRAQIRITSGMALALFLVFFVALFERKQLVYLGLAYIPMTSAILIMADWITAALLLAQARALRAWPLAGRSLRRRSSHAHPAPSAPAGIASVLLR